MDYNQEAFEKWVSDRSVCKKHGAQLNKNRDGSYRDYRINDRWLSWKASKEDSYNLVFNFKSKPLEPEFSKVLHENLWDMLEEIK